MYCLTVLVGFAKTNRILRTSCSDFLLNSAPLTKAFRVSWRSSRRRENKLDVSWTPYYNVLLNIQNEHKMDIKQLMSTNDHVKMNKLFVDLEIWN